MLRARGLDHIVLTVADPERSLAWYCGLLGLVGERVEEWRRGEVPFPSVRLDSATVIDLLAGERSGENVPHFCLVTEAADLEAVAAGGDFEVVGGPVRLWGAQGWGTGIYVRDPDGNVVELRHYG